MKRFSSTLIDFAVLASVGLLCGCAGTAPLKGGKNPTAAAAFVRYVTSEEGRAVLARFGFTAP